MKIRAKLFSSFFIIVGIGVLFAALGLFSNNRLVRLSEDIHRLAGTRTTISSILDSHYIWRHELSQAVYTGAEFSGSLDSGAYSPGIWFDSDAVNNASDPELLALLEQISEPHHFINDRAGKMLAHLAGGEKDEAVTIFQNDILPKIFEVISGLEIMQERYSVFLNEKTGEIYKNSKDFDRIIIAFVISASLACVVLTLLISSKIAKPILHVANTLKDIAHGEGDLTRNIVISSKDEVGDLARYFNQTLEKIKGLVVNIKDQASSLSTIETELSGNMNETAMAVSEITSNIKTIKDQVVNQSTSVTQTDATMEKIAVNINKLNGHIETQAASVVQSSSDIEQMLSSIQSVTRTLINNSENVEELTAASEVGHAGLSEVVSDIKEIAMESEDLLKINSVMKNIASQTNLLSMNAAIEAAHAGVAGRGFAVVADEIRKLAEDSSEQSKMVNTVLKKIKSSIDNITASINNVLLKFDAINLSVKTVAEQEVNIRNAMEEQDQGSKQILKAISHVNEITRLVKQGANEMLNGANEVIKEAGNLKRTTQEINGSMSDMATGAEQINAAVQNVNELSVQNQKNTKHLIREVSRFKVAA